MNFLSGYKSYIGGGLIVLVGILQLFGVVTPEIATTIYTIGGGILGVGFAAKAEKATAALLDVARPSDDG